ncbi:hypothetical protein CDIK_2679 [Cucumispora dikerogammari]|nr:hypothetical protein CDIK_2679 [Cucumispora dikerogammari]
MTETITQINKVNEDTDTPLQETINQTPALKRSKSESTSASKSTEETITQINKVNEDTDTPLQEAINQTPALKRSKSESTSASKSTEETERETLIEFIKELFYKTSNNKLKFELSEILMFLNGEDMTEMKELKKIVESLIIENESLITSRVDNIDI